MLTLVLLSLAAHRLWAVWHGAEIVRPLRERLIKRDGKLGYLASCEFCTSVWAGGLAVGIWLAPYGTFLLYALAAGVGLVAVQKTFDLMDNLSAYPRVTGQVLQTLLISRQQNGQTEVPK